MEDFQVKRTLYHLTSPICPFLAVLGQSNLAKFRRAMGEGDRKVAFFENVFVNGPMHTAQPVSAQTLKK